MEMTRADVHRSRKALMEAGLIATPHSCPEDDCDGFLFVDRDVEDAKTGRIIPVMVVCAKCFYTKEVPL